MRTRIDLGSLQMQRAWRGASLSHHRCLIVDFHPAANGDGCWSRRIRAGEKEPRFSDSGVASFRRQPSGRLSEWRRTRPCRSGKFPKRERLSGNRPMQNASVQPYGVLLINDNGGRDLPPVLPSRWSRRRLTPQSRISVNGIEAIKPDSREFTTRTTRALETLPTA